MIECLSINKSFHGKKILDNINLKLENNKVTSLVGSNGAGKSTLIGTIMEYYRLDSGELQKNSISVMPDADSIYDDLTGYDFLKFMSNLKKINSTKEALFLANKLGISDALKKQIKGYSFGMKKKISFIQACIGKYDTYIFDEPTSGVDEPSAIKMLNIVQSLKENGAAILLTSHNLDELERISDYIYIIDQGKIIKSGTVNEIISSREISNSKVYILKSNDSNQILDDLIAYSKTQQDIKLLNNQTLEITVINDEDIKKIMKVILENNYNFLELYLKKKSLRESVYSKK